MSGVNKMLCHLYCNTKPRRTNPFELIIPQLNFTHLVYKKMGAMEILGKEFKRISFSNISHNEYSILDKKFITEFWFSSKNEDIIFYLSLNNIIPVSVVNLISSRMTKRITTLYYMNKEGSELELKDIPQNKERDVITPIAGKYCKTCVFNSTCVGNTLKRHIKEHELMKEYQTLIDANPVDYEKLLLQSIEVKKFISRLEDDFMFRLSRGESFNLPKHIIQLHLNKAQWNVKAREYLKRHRHNKYLFNEDTDELISIEDSKQYLTDEELSRCTQ